MNEFSVDYAPDLDWMLQSDQVPREVLLEALLEEYYTQILRLAYSLLDDKKAASAAAREVFSTALVSVYTYREQMGVRNWLFSLALKVFERAEKRLRTRRSLFATLPLKHKADEFGDSLPESEQDAALWLAVDSLDHWSRLLVLLYLGHNWSMEDIAGLLQGDEQDVRSRLHAAKADLLFAAQKQEVQQPSEGDNPGKFEKFLRHSLNKRWRLPEVTPEELDEIQAGISKKALRKGRRRKGVSYSMEVALILLTILLAAGAIWGSNLVWPEPGAKPTATPMPTRVVTEIVYLEITATNSNIPKPLFTPKRSVTAFPTPSPVPTGILFEVKSGDQLSSISASLNTSEDFLRTLNRIPDGQEPSPGQLLIIPNRIYPLILPSGTPVPKSTHFPPSEPPYIMTEILALLRVSDQNKMPWHTVWLDANVHIYGPSGYIGPPRTKRIQVWLGKEQILVVIGTPERGVEEVWLLLKDKIYSAYPGLGQDWFTTRTVSEFYSKQMTDSLDLLGEAIYGSGSLPEGTTIKTLQREEHAGRAALVLEKENWDGRIMSRIWLDDQTGMVLRKQNFSQDEMGYLLNEVDLNAIEYDVDFPQQMLNPRLPWRGGFAQDSSGAPVSENISFEGPQNIRTPLPYTQAQGEQSPDLSRSLLTFQYPQAFQSTDRVALVDIFADQYFLGSMPFYNPWTLICDRSSDGSRIAFAYSDSLEDQALLHWVDLDNPLFDAHSPMDGIPVTEFAFAPDSHHLAVFGYRGYTAEGKLYILDTADDSWYPIIDLPTARSIVWSPDGTQLALITRTFPGSNEEYVLVLDGATGEILYNFSENIDYGMYHNMEWPMNEWGTKFPVEMGGLAACAAPP